MKFPGFTPILKGGKEEMPKSKIKTMKDIENDEGKINVFASYHFTAKSGKVNGFGNWIGKFEKGAYENNPKKFILDIQETISNLLEDKLGFEVAVKVLFFR